MFDLIAFSVFTFIFIFLCFDSIRQRLKNKNLLTKLAQSYLDIATVQTAASNNVTDTDGFIKFISESRDQAFEYIENVQLEISTFVRELDDKIKYWEKTLGVVSTPHDDKIKKVIEEYYRIKKLIPEDKNV